MNFEQLLKFAVDQNASDVHLQAGSSPQLRLGGLLRNVEGQLVGSDELRAFVQSIATPPIATELSASFVRGSIFSRTVEGVGRFRCALFSHIGQPGVTLRVIPLSVRTLDELHMPPVVRDIALARSGLVLVTGVAGTGKSATVAAMVDAINNAVPCKIVTLEETIETQHTRKKALVTQMELQTDFLTFEHAMTRATRHDPDVIVIDELNDANTAILALRAAEAGKQVIAVMPATNPVHTIERLLMLVGPAESAAAIVQIATHLEAIITQRLANTKDGGRRPAVEVLRGGPVTAKSLSERRFSDLRNLPAGRQAGMQKLEQHLIELYQGGLISGTEAMRLANEPDVVASQIRASR